MPSSSAIALILLSGAACVQAVPLALEASVQQLTALATQPTSAMDSMQSSAANAEAEASTPLHLRYRREFDGSPASAMHELSRGFKPSNRYFPLAMTIVSFLGFIVLLCIFKAVMKCRNRHRDHLPQTTFDQIIEEPTTFTRFLRRKRRGRQERDPSPPLSPGGKSFLAAIPEKAHSRNSSVFSFSSDRDAEEMSEPLPRYTLNQNSSSNSVNRHLPSFASAPSAPAPAPRPLTLVEKTVTPPPRVLKKELPARPAASSSPFAMRPPPRDASMPARRAQQATLGVGSGRAPPSVLNNGQKRASYERIVTA